jgi:filamentous hemagglutinin
LLLGVVGGVSLCIPPFCYGTSTVSGSLNSARFKRDFASVGEQSGVRAGDAGFQVNVAGNTDLKGGILSSSQAAIDAQKNSFITATLTHSDVQNRDTHSADGIVLAASVGNGRPTEANSLGQIRVGDGAQPLNGVPGGFISADGTRVFRPPTAKPNAPGAFNPTGVQANFQMRDPNTGAVTSNGHMVIK